MTEALSNEVVNPRAFPSTFSLAENVGLTKRELFAAMAMQATITADIGDDKRMAEDAVRRADALLAAEQRAYIRDQRRRSKQQKTPVQPTVPAVSPIALEPASSPGSAAGTVPHVMPTVEKAPQT